MKILILLLATALPICAEDWTVNGKNYKSVVTGKVEADRVHITYEGGVGTIMLVDLPPDLKKRFNYDPVAAKAASDVEAQREAQSDKMVASFEAKRIDQEGRQMLADEKEKGDEEIKSRLATIHINVLAHVAQKVDGGYLVLAESTLGPPNGDSMALVSDAPFFLVTGKDMVDGDRFATALYPIGEYSYIDTRGAKRTVRKFADNLDLAAKLF